jgi:hypothetical protein
MAKTESQAVTIGLDQLIDIRDEITGIDTQISAATGSEAAVRKSLANELANKNSEQVDSIVDRILNALNDQDLEVVIGVMDKFEDRLNEEFKPAIDELLDERVAKATAGSKENLDALKANRKTLIDAFRSMQTVLETFKVDTSSVPEPKRTNTRGSGSSGPKSAKNKEGYQYLMDGRDRPPSQNSFSSLAYYATVGVPKALNPDDTLERWGSKQMKDFIAEKGVKWGVDDEWEVTLPNDVVIAARRFTTDELAAFDAEEAKNKAEAEDAGEATTEDEQVEAVTT